MKGLIFSGVLLISLALCADAMIGNVQEKTMKKYSSTNTEVVRTQLTVTHNALHACCSESLTCSFVFFRFSTLTVLAFFTSLLVWLFQGG